MNGSDVAVGGGPPPSGRPALVNTGVPVHVGLSNRLNVTVPVGTGAGAAAPAAAVDQFPGLKFRNIGPATMGGRIDDLAVLESNPAVFYVGTATGGLWKTMNNGTTWEVLFDDIEDPVSIGDVAINPTDANTVWVGSGENNNRQSTSWGSGVYKSIDGGHTWKHMGLRTSKMIARVSRSRPETGIVTFKGSVRNAAGQVLAEMTSPIIVKRRAAVAAEVG